MATIDENLQSLENLKSSLKNTLANKGFDTTTTPFTSYPNLVQAMEKSVTRESLTVSPSTSAQTFMPTLGSLYSQVTVQSAPLQDLSITENGTYSADAGYYGIRSINVDVAGGGGGEDTLGQMIMGSLSQYTAPSFVTRIAQNAFYNNTTLKSGKFPYVSQIGSTTFYGASVEYLQFDRMVNGLSLSNTTLVKFISAPMLESLSTSALYFCVNLSSFYFPNLKYLNGQSIFGYVGSAVSQKIDVEFSNLISITGSGAFQNQSLFKTISLPNISVLPSGCFANSPILESVYGNFTSLASNCFSNTGILEASFPSITSLFAGTFSYCTKLSSVYMPNLSVINGADNFRICSNLRSITFSNLEKMIGTSNFYSCANLEVANFPNLSSMAAQNFFSCANLKSISVPKLQVLGSSNFASCVNLPEFVAPMLTSMYTNAFQSCYALSVVVLESTSFVSLSGNPFLCSPMSLSSYLGYFGSIYVPDSMVASYKTRANWSIYSNRITGLSNLPVEITVNVKDSNNNPMQFISVNFNNGTDFNASKGADSNGQIKIKLPVGVYTLTADSLEGWSSPQAQSITVVSQTPQTINLTYTLTQQNPVAYGVKIDFNNSDPETSVSYIDDAVGFSKSYMDFDNDQFVYGSWADKFPYNQIKPCLIKDGAVYKYLNPNNYAQDVDGNAVDITTGADGEVFVEFPKVYTSLHKDENYQYVEISNYQKNGSFDCLAHRYKNVEHNKLYISAYWLFVSNIQNPTPQATSSLSGLTRSSGNSGFWQRRTYIQEKGFQYMTYHQLTLIRMLYLVQFKNLDYTQVMDNSIRLYNTNTTGLGDSLGMFYGKNDAANRHPSKFYGIENFMCGTWIDGLYANNLSVYVVDTRNPSCEYNNTGANYIQVASNYGYNSGRIKKVFGTNEAGFLTDKSEYAPNENSYYCAYHRGGNSSSNTAYLFGPTTDSKNNIFDESLIISGNYSGGYVRTSLLI